MNKIKKILAANRSEIAIRIFRAAEESVLKQPLFIPKKTGLLFIDLKQTKVTLLVRAKDLFKHISILIQLLILQRKRV